MSCFGAVLLSPNWTELVHWISVFPNVVFRDRFDAGNINYKLKEIHQFVFFRIIEQPLITVKIKLHNMWGGGCQGLGFKPNLARMEFVSSVKLQGPSPRSEYVFFRLLRHLPAWWCCADFDWPTIQLLLYHPLAEFQLGFSWLLTDFYLNSALPNFSPKLAEKNLL